ncbi:hypothetical protein D1007_24763 [Hordeum vulgare]|nr:hypothetical protein D1007_24763 [Hordeum vulgare]
MTDTERIFSNTLMEFSVHPVEIHMRKTDLTMVYTNDPVKVEDSINTMEWLLAGDEKYKVVGFDLTYTGGRVGHDQKVVITQFPDYRFATVDTTNNRKVLKTSGLAFQKLVDIRGHYKLWGSTTDMESDVDLAKAIIDPYYRGMKAECNENKPTWNMAWVKRLDEHHIQTTDKEAYTCYGMFRWIVDMRNCLLPEYVEGSS